MLVEQPTCDQLALHLAKLLTDLPSLGSVFTPRFKLVRSVLSMTEVRRRDPRSSVLGPRTSAGPTMQSAPAILFVSRTLTRGPPPCLRTTPLPGPVRSEPPLDTDGNVIFCEQRNSPDYRVILYRKLSGALLPIASFEATLLPYRTRLIITLLY